MGKLKIWYDAEGDFLEVVFADRPGEFRPTESERVLLKVDKSGQMIGFAVMKVSSVDKKPLEIVLPIEDLRRVLVQHGVFVAV